MSRLRTLLLLSALFSAPALAVIETYEWQDEGLRERFAQLSFELRCPKCQNQNIADSNAPIAADLREQLHEQLHAGRSDEEIIDYMVQRYGDFVLYRPRWNKVTLVLWLAPALLLALAVWILVVSLRGQAVGESAEAALSEEEQAKLDALLKEGSERD